MRNISDVLLFRNDISPFLVHLTRDYEGKDAEDNLVSILKSMKLKYGSDPISVAWYRYPWSLNDAKTRIFFKAISFTETPLDEISNLLSIENRAVDFSACGLVFLKEECALKGVSPVIYINNLKGDKDKLVEMLCRMTESHPLTAAQILPFVSFFGEKLKPWKKPRRYGQMDFTWEREWRFAHYSLDFKFDRSDLFIGLCPHNRIGEFEGRFPWLGFVDPRRRLSLYADKLQTAQRRTGIENRIL